MKKVSIKQVIIFVVTLFILLCSTYYFCNVAIEESKTTKTIKKDNKLSDKEIEYRKEKYIKELSCVPKKNIDKGIIYAEAMKQYWNTKMVNIWGHYYSGKDSAADDERHYSELVKSECGLEEEFFGKRWYSKNDYFPHITMKNGVNKIYNPEKDDYLYEPENYNKNVDFTVYMKFQNLYYKEDCCKLLDYNEMIKEVNDIKKLDNIHIFQYEYRIERLNVEVLSKIYFLRVIENGGNYRDKDYIEYNYYPVSLCGKVPYYFDK